jgi:protein involved in polysaccharide export with SLBB domain
MRLLQCSVRHFIGIAGWAAATLILAGCVTDTPLPPPNPPQATDTNLLEKIPLQIGDSIEVDLTGTPMEIKPLPFTLNGSGIISLPLLETNITAIGKSPHDLEQIIKDLYVQAGQFTHINVTVTPGNRYYYVTGEIKDIGSGKQLYVGKVTVLRAIAATGGFTDFAARNRVQLTRQSGRIHIINCKKALHDQTLDLEVFPGDKIFVDKQTVGEAMFGL